MKHQNSFRLVHAAAWMTLLVGLWVWTSDTSAQESQSGQRVAPQQSSEPSSQPGRTSGTERPANSEQTGSSQVESLSAHESIEQLSLYVKVVGGVIAIVTTLLGLPMVRLRNKKTRAEIEKINLQSQELREKLSGAESAELDTGVSAYRIHVEKSPHTTVQILADPRFLAPLLLLIDFILAWILLTLAEYLLAIVGFSWLRSIALAFLAVFLLIPIAKQALRTRRMFNPERSAEDIAAVLKQLKVSVHFVLGFISVSALAFGAALLIFDRDDSSALMAGTALFIAGIVSLGLWALLRRRINRYLESFVC